MAVEATLSYRPVQVELRLRPLRLGFLVDPSDRSMLSRVFRLASCLWGGPMCPIIPMAESMPEHWATQIPCGKTSSDLTLDYLRFFEPEVLVETKPGQLSGAGIHFGNNPASNERIAPITKLDDHLVDGSAVFPWGITMDIVFDYLMANARAREEFKSRQIAGVWPNEAQTGDIHYDEVALGLFPVNESLKRMKDAFVSLLFKFAADEQSDNPLVNCRYVQPLKCSTYALFPIQYSKPLEFFVFDPSSPTDVTEFWNYRLVNVGVIPLSVTKLPKDIELIVRALELEESSRQSKRTRSLASIYVAPSLRVENVEPTIRKELETRSSLNRVNVVASNVTASISTSNNEPEFYRPSQIQTKSETIQVIATKDTSYSVLLPVLKPDFVTDTNNIGLWWVNVRTEHYSDEDDELASAVRSAWLDEMSSSFWNIVGYPSREGYVSFHNFPNTNRQVSLVTRKDAIYKWLSSRRFEVSPSDAGCIADEVISSVGGLNQMHLCANVDTINLFNKMAVQRRYKEDFAEELSGRTASIAEIKKHIRSLEKKQGNPKRLLQRYVNSGILQLGIAAKCVHCAKQNWYSLDAISSEIWCERCRKDFRFPEGEFPSDSLWRYRVVGPFATPDYAQGAYSVALTLAFLKGERLSGNAFTFITGTTLERDKVNYEIDFFAWHQPQHTRFRPAPSTFVGECKSFGSNTFKEKDVKRLKTIGDLFPEAFLVVSTLKKNFDAGEVKQLRKLANWCWSRSPDSHNSAPLIALTGNELFEGIGLYGYRRISNERVREIYAQAQASESFINLARATQQAHLRIEPSQILSSGEE